MWSSRERDRRHSLFQIQPRKHSESTSSKSIIESAKANASTHDMSVRISQQSETIRNLIIEVARLEKKLREKSEENYLLKTEVENISKLYFFALGRSIKLQALQLNWPPLKYNLYELYDDVIIQQIPISKWPDWLTSKFEKPTPSSYSSSKASIATLGSSHSLPRLIPWGEYVSRSEYILKPTYFGWDEINVLYGKIATGAPSFTRKQIISLLTEEKDTHLQLRNSLNGSDSLHPSQLIPNNQGEMVHVIERVFEIITKDDNSSFVSMGPFIDILSVISRGPIEERLRLVFDMIDFDGDGIIHKEDFTAIAYAVGAMLALYQPSLPEDIAEDLFGRGEEEKKEIDCQNFILLSRESPDIYKCFGLFDFIQSSILSDIINLEHRTETETSYVDKLTPYQHSVLKRFFSGKAKNKLYEIRDGFMIGYKKIKKKIPSEVLCLVNAAVIVTNLPESSSKHTKTTFFLKLPGNEPREFIAQSPKQAYEWVNAIRSNSYGGFRHNSFAPVRKNIECKWYVNAAEYYQDLCITLPKARKEIFIAGWWLTPKVYLQRQCEPLDKHRLDQILLERARAGVQIYILIWDETTFGFRLESKFTKDYLEKLHKNIHVMRHPRYTPIVWSNHQKAVIIDQSVAFLGGIDLCYGRYDDEFFRVVDLDEKMYPGLDYSNGCLGLPLKNDHSTSSLLDRTKQARMPWHDIQACVEGMAAKDVSFNFIQRWNHAVNDFPKYHLLFPSTDPPLTNISNIVGDSKVIWSRCEVQILRSVSEWSAGCPVEDSIYKAYIHMISTAKHFIFIQNQFFISSVGDSVPKNKIAQAITRRVRRAILDRETFRVFILLPVHPEGSLNEQATRVLILWTMRTINSIVQTLNKEFPDVNMENYITFNSLRNWGTAENVIFTEQVYVHAKLMIIDDNITIIGSANINDRSMNGSRDSEIAAIIRDTTTIDSLMDGEPYKAGIFAHSLRMKLWKCHLGLHNIKKEDIFEESLTPDSFTTTSITPNINNNNSPNNQEEKEEREQREDNEKYQKIKDPISTLVYHDLWRAQAKLNTEIYKEVFEFRIPENCKKLTELRRQSVLSLTPLINDANNDNNIEQMGVPSNDINNQDGVSNEISNDNNNNNNNNDNTLSEKEYNEIIKSIHPHETLEDKLKKTKGYLVEYPVGMLSEEELSPSILSAEWLVDQKIFL